MVTPNLQLTEEFEGPETPDTLPFPEDGDPRHYRSPRFRGPGDAFRALQHLTMTLDELLSELEGGFHDDGPAPAA